MEFIDLSQPFTDKQNVESFLYLQNYILEKNEKKEPFFIGRLSGNEPNLCGKVLTKTNIDNRLLHEMLTTAGIQMKLNNMSNYIIHRVKITIFFQYGQVECILKQNHITIF